MMDEMDEFDFEREDYAFDVCTSQWGVYELKIMDMVETVICALPEKDWNVLRSKRIKFFFHLGGTVLSKAGMIRWFDGEDVDYIVMILRKGKEKEDKHSIAHELSHIILGHPDLDPLSSKGMEKKEEEARKLAKSWGFGEEA